MKARVRIAVIRLGRIAIFRLLFRFYYHAAWSLFPPLARFLFPEINSIKLHRGYASADWEPGVSDIDMVLEISPLAPEENACFMREWNRFYRAFKIIFPIMGEPVISTPGEQELYLACGDIRSLPGRTTAGVPRAPGEAKTALDLWTECLHAHTRLCKLAVSAKPAPGPLAARELRKCVLDIARHSAAAPSRPPLQAVGSRLETERGLKDFTDFPAPELCGILERASSSREDDRGVKHLAQLACAHAAGILEQDALKFFRRFDGFTGPAPAAAGFAAPPTEDEAARHMLELFKKRFGGFFDSAVLDNIFTSAVAFKYVPGAAEDLGCGISILDCMAEWNPAMRGPVFVLGPKSMQLMGISPYEDDPLKMALPGTFAGGAGSAVCLQSGAEAPFSPHRRTFYCAGQNAALAPRPPLLKLLYLESLSHFLRTWRGLLPPWPGGPVYAVSRAMSLWLYFVKDIAQPCFPLQPLLGTFKWETGAGDETAFFETSLLRGLQPRAIEIISALNMETLAAAAQNGYGIKEP